MNKTVYPNAKLFVHSMKVLYSTSLHDTPTLNWFDLQHDFNVKYKLG